MKILLTYTIAFFAAIVASGFILFQIRSVQRAVNALEQTASDIRIIRYTLNPASAMRGSPAPEKIAETDIQL